VPQIAGARAGESFVRGLPERLGDDPKLGLLDADMYRRRAAFNVSDLERNRDGS